MWWSEISKADCIGVGGPTGIYTMVVLMTWWCSLLKGRPDSQHTEYTVMVEQLNRAILAAVSHVDQHNAPPSPADPLSPTTPPPPSQYSIQYLKRMQPEEALSSRKRLKA